VSVLKGISVEATRPVDRGHSYAHVRVAIACPAESAEWLALCAGCGDTTVSFQVRDASRARELAQHFQAVCDELVVFAQAQERKKESI